MKTFFFSRNSFTSWKDQQSLRHLSTLPTSTQCEVPLGRCDPCLSPQLPVPVATVSLEGAVHQHFPVDASSELQRQTSWQIHSRDGAVSAAPTTAEAWLEATKTENNEASGALAPLAPDRLLNEVSHQRKKNKTQD